MSRAVDEASAAAVDPANLDLPAPQQPAVGGDLARRAAPPDGDQLGMFAQQQGDLAVVPGADLLDQPPLKLQAPAEVDPSQQKRLDRGRLLLGFLRGGGHGGA